MDKLKNMKECTNVNYQHFTLKFINSLIIISYYCIHKEKINYLTTEKHEKNYFIFCIIYCWYCW